MIGSQPGRFPIASARSPPSLKSGKMSRRGSAEWRCVVRPSFPMVMPTSTRRGYLWALCLITCLTPAAAWCDNLYYPPIPEEDYGTWVPEKQPCNSPTRIVVGKNEIIFHMKGAEHAIREISVSLDCNSGSAGSSIANCIFPTKDYSPSFDLFFFPGEDVNKLVYSVLRPKLLPPGFPDSDKWFRRCPLVR